MIRSMTGFGKGEFQDGKRIITVEIKAVNHRYFEAQVRMPRRYSFLEDKVKNVVKEKLVRGKVDISILVENVTENDVSIKLNEPVAREYYDCLVELKSKFDVYGDINLSTLATMPEVIKVSADIDDEEEITRSILEPVNIACDKLEEMRMVEGEKLKNDLLFKGDEIKAILDKIEERCPNVIKEYTYRLKDRIQELVGQSIDVPMDRILIEAAIFADKAAIDEEITRLNSHLNQLKKILAEGGSVGKKLDFLVQEMNREANTIGSKANDLDITNMMLDIKALVEKIREQVQNIE